MPYYINKDIKIYYETYGDGEAIFFIGGLGMTCEGWFFQKNFFSKDFRVVLIDNRGAGRSSDSMKDFTISDMVEDIVGLMEYIDIESANFVCLSMGGFIGLEMAYRYPNKFLKLILSNSAAKLPEATKFRLKLWEEMRIKNIELALQIKEQLLWVFPENIFGNNQFLNTTIANMVNFPFKQSNEGYKKQVKACISFDATPYLADISISTLIFASTDDLIIPINYSQELALKIPNSEFITMDNAGHVIPTLKSEEFNRLVYNFINNDSK